MIHRECESGKCAGGRAAALGRFPWVREKTCEKASEISGSRHFCDSALGLACWDRIGERAVKAVVRPCSAEKLAHPYRRRKFFLPASRLYRLGGLLYSPFNAADARDSWPVEDFFIFPFTLWIPWLFLARPFLPRMPLNTSFYRCDPALRRSDCGAATGRRVQSPACCHPRAAAHSPHVS